MDVCRVSGFALDLPNRWQTFYFVLTHFSNYQILRPVAVKMSAVLNLTPLDHKSDLTYLTPPLTEKPSGKRLKLTQSKSRKATVESPFVRCMEARAMIGGRSLLERAERAGWIKPVRRGKRMTLFKRTDVQACIERIAWGELP
jgi:hypothetical protein